MNHFPKTQYARAYWLMNHFPENQYARAYWLMNHCKGQTAQAHWLIKIFCENQSARRDWAMRIIHRLNTQPTLVDENGTIDRPKYGTHHTSGQPWGSWATAGKLVNLAPVDGMKLVAICESRFHCSRNLFLSTFNGLHDSDCSRGQRRWRCRHRLSASDSV